MPHMRQVFVPHAGHGQDARSSLRAYIDGNDPITGRPVMQEVIEGLTRPFDDEDLKEVTFERSTPRLVEPDTEENLHRLFHENLWTDQLPIILPTEERVAAMLAHTSHKPDEVVGRMRATHFREYWEYTVEKVAVNAVMAGARPEYFPVILALAATGASARGSTSSSAAAMVVVNGPVRHELGMNCGHRRHGTAQPRQCHHRAGLRPAVAEPAGRVPCRASPTWARRATTTPTTTSPSPRTRSAVPGSRSTCSTAFKPTDSAVSVFTGCRSTAFTLGLREKHWREHTRHMLRGMDPHNPPTLLLDPLTAQEFIDRGGFTNKEKLIDWLYDNARMPASEYWDYQLIQNYIYPRATFGEEPWASKLKALPDELIPMFRREDIHVVVVGGETNPYWRIMGCNYQKTVSVDAWR